jgi:carotenoid 1,2-hydratase
LQPLDAAGRHRWCPIAPRARIEVDLPRPGLRWQGDAYVDGNFGDVPLEQDFARWDWARAPLPGGRSAVLYDVERRDGSRLALAFRFDADGTARAADPPPDVALPRTGWGLDRHGRSEGDGRVLRTVEDGPFYVRSLLQARWFGEPVTAMHESLSLRRFDARWVQALLPWRMPRRR